MSAAQTLAQKLVARAAGRAPLLANMVEGGKTPVLPVADLERIGFAIAIFPRHRARRGVRFRRVLREPQGARHHRAVPRPDDRLR
jgi:2-methylisocitrate lyase-like PEP mutase family enzyme